MKIRQYVLLAIVVLLIVPVDVMSLNIFKRKKVKEPTEELFYVYKTRYNYANLIPVILNDSKSEILCMPTKELLINADGSFNLPKPLSNGYLMCRDFDFKGNIAFLNLTIDEYLKSEHLPNAEDQIKYVKDFEPFRELYIFKCSKDKDPIEEANRLITSNQIRTLPNLMLK